MLGLEYDYSLGMDNTTAATKTLIQFTLITKRGRTVIKVEPCWLATCSFADGPGMKVKKMSTTRDINKAARWSLATAHEIAVQFSHLPASLVSPDGTVKAEETAKLQAAQSARHESIRRMNAEINAEFNRALMEIPAVRKILTASI